MSDDFDILIKNATIVDGTGEPPYKGAVAVKGERIAAVGRLEGDLEKGAGTIIDARGFVTSPGFIDVHNHGDVSILHYPEAEGFLRQGVTTFVGGNCGSSPGPYGDYVDLGMFLYDIHYEVNPDMYYPDGLVQRELLNERHREAYGWEIDWHTLGDFFKRVEAEGISPNYVPIVGHHPIRNIVMGKDFRRTATGAEVEEMKAHLRQAMKDGCRGFSVGRDYESSYYADLGELVTLAKVAAEYSGVYTSHSLRTGLRKARRPGGFPPVKVEGLKEAIEVGRQAGITVQISHLGTLYDVTPRGDPELAEAAARATLKIVDDAREEGVDVHFDMIPNNRGFGIYSSNWLVASLLPWLKVAGSREQLAEALRMREFREEIKEKIWAGKWYRLNPNINPNWAGTQRIKECEADRFVDKTLTEVAEELGKEPLDALMDVLMIDPYAKVGTRGFDNPTKGMFYRHPASMVGIDTFAVDTEWVTKHPPWYRPSENSFGGFAAYFRNAVRENEFLSVEEAVRKVTSLPAGKFGLSDRGVLKSGAYADIVVMDLEKVTPKAGPLTPNVYSEGLEHVIVNGELVVRDSIHTGVRPGKILYRE
jgi:N-acyl-D-aspartate/D-glutamate deacylase